MLPFSLLLQLINCFQEGQALLSHGSYEWFFKTKGKPVRVFIAEGEEGSIPVCQGGVNKFGVQLRPDGFVLVADVLTDRTHIYWQAELELHSS